MSERYTVDGTGHVQEPDTHREAPNHEAAWKLALDLRVEGYIDIVVCDTKYVKVQPVPPAAPKKGKGR